jgi:hypothetical protein
MKVQNTLKFTINKMTLIAALNQWQKIYGNMLSLIPVKTAIRKLEKFEGFQFSKSHPSGLVEVNISKTFDEDVEINVFLDLEVEDSVLVEKMREVETQILTVIQEQTEAFSKELV